MLVAAAISVCLAGQPTACEKHELRIERKLCNVSSRAEINLNGEWQPATARIVCQK